MLRSILGAVDLDPNGIWCGSDTIRIQITSRVDLDPNGPLVILAPEARAKGPGLRVQDLRFRV